MNFIKSITKQIYEYLHKHWVKAHFQKFKSFNKCLSYNGMVKLSDAVTGAYKFSGTYCNDKLAHRVSEHNHHHAHMYLNCNDKLAHRLLELGFVRNEKIVVIENRGSKGGVMVKVKGSKIVLNHRVAEKILLKRK
jgi:Fe2+ transport system protein FeoA